MEELTSYIWLSIGAFIIGLVTTNLIRKWATTNRLMPTVRSRDLHTQPIPRLGGFAIALSFWVIVLLILAIMPNKLQFTSEMVVGIDRNFLGVIAGAFIIITTMMIDDLRGLPWSAKLVAQFVAAIAVAAGGITIHWFSNPFGSNFTLSSAAFDLGMLSVTWGQIFVVIWIVFVMNVINWLDGVDGLAGGISVIAASSLFLLAINPAISQGATAILACILIGSILGFLPFNMNPAKIFLGDTGSMFIGYMLAILAIISGGKVATAALVLGIPILDSLWVITNRLAHHRSPFLADKTHLHHRLIQAGLHPRQAVIVLYVLTAIFGYLALESGTYGKFIAGLWLVAVMVFIAVGLLILEWHKSRKSRISRQAD